MIFYFKIWSENGVKSQSNHIKVYVIHFRSTRIQNVYNINKHFHEYSTTFVFGKILVLLSNDHMEKQNKVNYCSNLYII